MSSSYDDAAAADRFENPDKRTSAGPGRPVRRTRKPGLSSHVPVRFSAEVIAAVKRLADIDGVTVSTWIRSLVLREVQRRQPSPTTNLLHPVSGAFDGGTPPNTDVRVPERNVLLNA